MSNLKKLARLIGTALMCSSCMVASADSYVAPASFEETESAALLSESENLRNRLDNLCKDGKETEDKVVSKKVELKIDKPELSIGQRFLQRYYAATGRTYSKPEVENSSVSNITRSQNVINDEVDINSSTLGSSFLERYEQEKYVGEPDVFFDPDLSLYEERSVDCQYLDYTSGINSVIYVKPGFKTDIILPAGDKLQRITAGDKQRFSFSTFYNRSESRWHIYIQPYQYDIATNIIISTDRHNFQARLETSELFKPYVKWNVPDDISNGYKTKNVVMSVENIKDLNFGYSHTRRPSDLFPQNVFDDKYWNTYLSFEKDVLLDVNPVILAYLDDGRLAIVPYEKRGDIIVMHSVYKAFEVRIDNRTVEYRRED